MPARFKTFDVAQAQAMREAFNGAWKSLVDSGSPEAIGDAAELARETLVLRIIEKALAGEHDMDRLRNDALEFLAQCRNVKRT